MPRVRYPSPEVLVGALALSDDDDLDADEIVRLVFARPEVKELVEEIRGHLRRMDGPDRRGDWLRPLVHKVASGTTSIEQHYKHAPGDLWRRSGFPANPRRMGKRKRCRPGKSGYYLRSADLAEPACVDMIYDTVRKLVAEIQARHPMFARYLTADGTAVQAHVDFEHDCDDAECPSYGKKRKGPRPTRREGGQRGDEDWRDWEEDDPAINDEPLDLPPPDLVGQVWEFRDEKLEIQRKHDGRMRIRVIRTKNGKEAPSCWFRTRCKEAWLRMYTHKDGSMKRIWIGYIQQDFTDVLTGALICARTFSARRNEASTFMETFERLETVAGKPKAIAYDMAADVTSLYEAMTSHDVALVTPMKKDSRAPAEGRNFLSFDHHGAGRCPDCRSAGTQVRFSAAEPGGPRVWFACPICEDRNGRPKQFSLNCSRDWRRLTPLSRQSPVFHELLVARGNREGPHADRRERWGIAGNDVSSRLRRIGTDWQDLHAALAALIEVTLVGYRLGVFEGAKLAKLRVSDYKKNRGEKLDALNAWRRERKLHLPYGAGIAVPTKDRVAGEVIDLRLDHQRAGP